MARSGSSRGVPRWLLVAGALALSFSALAALVRFELASTNPTVELRDDSAARRPPRPAPPPVPPVPPSAGHSGLAARADLPKVGASAAVPPAPAAPDADAEAEAAAAPSVRDGAARGDLVPDFVGLRLTTARRRARALGLRFVARDASGERVLPEDATYYRVSRQNVEPGTPVVNGTTVVFRVRESDGSYGQGY